MHTEDEAKELWCSAVRSKYHGFTAPGRTDEAARCIASQCMWWRWEWTESFRRADTKGEKQRGYCGAAGRPEG